MEFANFTANFLQLLGFSLLLCVTASFVFKNKKELISLITKFLLLVFVNVFVISQFDFMVNNFPNHTYGMIGLLILTYFICIKDLYAYIKSKKTI